MTQIDLQRKDKNSYIVRPVEKLTLKEGALFLKRMEAFGARERLGQITMDPWLAWNYLRIHDLEGDIPEVQDEIKLRQSYFEHDTWLTKVKPNLNPMQVRFVEFFHNQCKESVLNACTMGTGKAQPLDAKVLTPTGWKLMGELCVGDELVSPVGGTTFVTGIFPQGEKDVYEVKFTDGRKTECCEDHLWSVKHKHPFYAKQGFVTKSLKEIIPTLKDKAGYNNWYVPNITPVDYISDELKIHPYLLGALLGDGYLRSNTVEFTTADLEMIDHLNPLLPKSVELHNYFQSQWRLRRRKTSGPNELLDLLRELNLAGTHSDTKFVPEQYLFSSAENRLALIQGLLDTDGSVSVNGKKNKSCTIEYSTASPYLAEAMQFLVRSLGGVVTTKLRKIQGFKDSYRMHLKFPEGLQPFRLTRKLNLYTAPTKYPPKIYMESARFVRRAECQCISVSCPSQLYITDDFVVTHNTRMALAAALAQNPEAPMLIITLKSTKHQWEEELKTLGYEGPIRVLEGRDFLIPERGVAITSWHNLPPLKAEAKNQCPLEGYLGRLPKDFFIIADEAHAVKSTKALVTKRFRKLKADILKRGGKVIGLTGTPIQNKPQEFWNVLSSLGLEKQAFGNYENFCKLFGGRLNPWLKIMEFDPDFRDNEEIKRRLKYVMFREAREDNRIRNEREFWVDITKNSTKALDDLFDKTQSLSDDEVLALLRGKVTFEKWSQIQAALAKEKLKAAMELIENLEEYGPVLACSTSVEVVEALGKRKGWAFIDGNVTSAQKRDEIRQQLNSGKLKGLAFTIRAGGTGMNVPGAQNMVLINLDPNPAMNRQAMGRNDRHNTTFDELNYFFVLANHKFERRLGKILMDKAKLADDILD